MGCKEVGIRGAARWEHETSWLAGGAGESRVVSIAKDWLLLVLKARCCPLQHTMSHKQGILSATQLHPLPPPHCSPFSAHAAASSRVKCGSCMSTGSRCHRPCVTIWLISIAAREGMATRRVRLGLVGDVGWAPSLQPNRCVLGLDGLLCLPKYCRGGAPTPLWMARRRAPEKHVDATPPATVAPGTVHLPVLG